MYYFLYKTTNTVNGKIYIGVHHTDNLDDGYMGSGKVLKSAIEKYGIGNFTREILEYFNSIPEMYDKEKDIVNEDFVSRDDVYNIRHGGNGGWAYLNKSTDPEIIRQRKEWSAAGGRKGGAKARGRVHPNRSEEYKEKIVETHWARDADRKAEVCKKISKANIGKDNGWTGKQHTEETKKIIGLKNSFNHSGQLNSQFGTCWVTHAEFGNKKIKFTELGSYINLGYNKGRKM